MQVEKRAVDDIENIGTRALGAPQRAVVRTYKKYAKKKKKTKKKKKKKNQKKKNNKKTQQNRTIFFPV